jgi:hypothetical protein
MGIGELARYCGGKANGSIPNVCSGFGVRKACRCARSNGRVAGLEYRRQLARERERANQVWSWDIIQDQTQAGSSLRILTLIDEYTKQCLAIEVGRSIRALDAIRETGKNRGLVWSVSSVSMEGCQRKSIWTEHSTPRSASPLSQPPVFPGLQMPKTL